MRIPCHLEPTGLYCSDGKHPDGAFHCPMQGWEGASVGCHLPRQYSTTPTSLQGKLEQWQRRQRGIKRPSTPTLKAATILCQLCGFSGSFWARGVVPFLGSGLTPDGHHDRASITHLSFAEDCCGRVAWQHHSPFRLFHADTFREPFLTQIYFYCFAFTSACSCSFFLGG